MLSWLFRGPGQADPCKGRDVRPCLPGAAVVIIGMAGWLMMHPVENRVAYRVRVAPASVDGWRRASGEEVSS